MHVEELFYLTKWVGEEIVGKKVPQKYQQLQGILSQNAQPGQPQTPFESQKNELISLIEEITTESLSREQVEYLNKLKILSSVGKKGVVQLEDILFRNVIDVATAAQKVQTIINNLNEGLNKIKLVSDGLKGCVEEGGEEVKDEALMRVSFLRKSAISNVIEFKDWGTKWHDIGRGVAMAHGAVPEDIRVIGASRGSVILELVTSPIIAKTISSIILEALKVADKIQDIRKKAAEVEGLRLQNKRLAQEIKEAAEQEKERGVKELVDNQSKALIRKKEDGDKAVALEKAIRTLVDFIDGGGEIDFVVPEAKEGDASSQEESIYSKIRSTAQEIRKLEDHLLLLENHVSEE